MKKKIKINNNIWIEISKYKKEELEESEFEFYSFRLFNKKEDDEEIFNNLRLNLAKDKKEELYDSFLIYIEHIKTIIPVINCLKELNSDKLLEILKKTIL